MAALCTSFTYLSHLFTNLDNHKFFIDYIFLISSKAPPPPSTRYHTPYMPHPLLIELSNIYSHVKSQIPSIKNYRVMVLLVIYSKATPPKVRHPLHATPPAHCVNEPASNFRGGWTAEVGPGLGPLLPCLRGELEIKLVIIYRDISNFSSTLISRH